LKGDAMSDSMPNTAASRSLRAARLRRPNTPEQTDLLADIAHVLSRPEHLRLSSSRERAAAPRHRMTQETRAATTLANSTTARAREPPNERVLMSFLLMSDPVAARRLFLGRSSLVLSGAAVALLAGNDALAAKAGDAAADARILNTALGAELEAIAAYQVGAESKLLQKPVLDLALTFQGHHKEHAELLAKTVEKLGGKPVAPKAKYDFPLEQLKAQADVLAFAAKLEQGAVSAYLGAVPLFDNRELSKAAASILGDEAMHWAVLRQALGEAPVPSAFVS
jgi:rubrerythrin